MDSLVQSLALQFLCEYLFSFDMHLIDLHGKEFEVLGIVLHGKNFEHIQNNIS